MKRLMLKAAVILALILNAPVHGNGGEKIPVKSFDKSGKAREAKGYVAMKAAPGAKKFEASPKIRSAPLPRKVDLRAGMTKIEDQGDTSSCVANAVAGSFEYWVKRATKQDYDVSRLFVYYNARWRNGDQDKDEGSVIQLAMEGLKEFGACPEEKWPFQKPLLLKKPAAHAYKEASKVKIKEMAQVPLELTAWKQALASGYPIVFGCLLFESFDECNQRGGVVPMPSPEEAGRESHGGHAMCVVGYSDKEQVFIVRNSWGDQWGDNGYCYIPYNYLLNPKFNDGDSWVFVPEAPIANPEDTWFDDDKPVTDGGRGVTFVINTYPIESYKDVVLTWWEEATVEYTTTMPAQYVEYTEYADAAQWDSMEQFEYEDVVAEWQEENPGEDASLYVYEDTGGEEETMEDSEEAGDAGEADMDAGDDAAAEEDDAAEIGDEDATDGEDTTGEEEVGEEDDQSSDEEMNDGEDAGADE